MTKYLLILYIIVSILLLPLLVVLARTAQIYLSRAGGVKANIVVDAQNTGVNLPRPWSYLAQGGEENPPMLKSVVSDIKNLSPSYIRIDHIYDLYSVVSKTGNRIILDFTKLDDTVNDILASGALPLLSLSYMPPALSTDGNVTSAPSNWNDWEAIVKATVEHYSGKSQKNLSNVYYEVWNEPDLFGKWTIGGVKDYRVLYLHSVTGANQALNVNKFFIGGPATTALYSDWNNGFLNYVASNNLRLDFFSWHRYSLDPSQYAKDGDSISSTLVNYPAFANIPFLLTEWTIDAGNNPFFDNQVSAAHEIASLRQMLSKINMAFTFEIKDGPSPNNSPLWGRWGLITSDKAGLFKKPRYYALRMVNTMVGKRLTLSGEGSWVTGFAAGDGNTIRLILTNYDSESLNAENVPVTFTHLESASYTLTTSYLRDFNQSGLVSPSGKYEFTITSGSLSQKIPMNPNDVVLLTLTKSASFAAFTPGSSGNAGDQALVINSNPLIISSPSLQLSSSGSISFDLKPNWGGNDNIDRVIFDVPLTTGAGPPKRLALQKKNIGFSNKLVFGLFDQSNSITTTSTIDGWVAGKWYKLSLRWNPSALSISIDNQITSQLNASINIGGGGTLTFYPIDAAIDNLAIESNGKVIIQRTFDGSVDK